MPHIISFDAITGKPAPQGDLSLGVRGPLSLVQHDGQTFYKGPGGQLLGPLGGEGVFSAQNIDEKGSVIVGDNHFTGAGGDSLTGNETSQLPDQPTDDFIKLGDIKGELQTTDLRSENRFFEELIKGSDFVASPNPYLEIGANSGPLGTSFMTGQFDMPTDNLSGTAGPGGSSF
jgi:hypothetical protein